jgi:hypothetical protein
VLLLQPSWMIAQSVVGRPAIVQTNLAGARIVGGWIVIKDHVGSDCPFSRAALGRDEGCSASRTW